MARPTRHPTRLRWLDPDWLADAHAWIGARLAEHGVPLAGEIEQLHVQWWSTVMRVPAQTGDLWFKASAPVHAFEPGLIGVLADLRPGLVPDLVAADPARGWMLMRDSGRRVRELIAAPEDLVRWEEILPAYAELQLAASHRVGELLAAGVPDERLGRLPAHLEAVLADTEALRLDRPGGLTSGERERLLTLGREFAGTCERLARIGVPETIQHDDLHDGNVFAAGGAYRILDWGDSSVSHPFHTLVVTLRAIAHRLAIEPGGELLLRLRDAYLGAFSEYGTRADLAAAADLAHVTGTAARALAWHRFVSSREPEFKDGDAEAIAYGLRRLLDPGPLGSWR